MRLVDPTQLLTSANADAEFLLAARCWDATLSLETPSRASSTPEMGQALAPAGPGATFRTMPELGHFPMCENPARFREYILPVLDEIRTRHGG